MVQLCTWVDEKDTDTMTTIYNYLDYRKYLDDKVASLKSDTAHFSFRAFNKRAGFGSPSFLRMVINRERNLSENAAGQVALGLSLGRREAKHFVYLVQFNQAKSHHEKQYYFEKMLESRNFLKAKLIVASQYKICTHWYYVAILELIRVPSGEMKDEKWLQEHVSPHVSLPNVKNAVQDLLDAGLLKRKKSGSLERIDAMITTEDECSALCAVNYHKEISKIAIHKVEHDNAKDREFSTLTVAVSQDTFEEIKGEMIEFRKRLRNILESQQDKNIDQVAHLNLQLFKLTERVES